MVILLTPVKFQFQDGSIKWSSLFSSITLSKPFQFQDGSIKWDQPKQQSKFISMFQFQDGSIKCAPKLLRGKTWKVVSIPRWFD